MPRPLGGVVYFAFFISMASAARRRRAQKKGDLGGGVGNKQNDFPITEV